MMGTGNQALCNGVGKMEMKALILFDYEYKFML